METNTYLCTVERDISYYKNYFLDFYQSIEYGAQRKMDSVLDMLKTQQRVNSNFVSYIHDGIYEIKVKHRGNIYRVFFIFDGNNIVMLFNGFQKKTQKAPKSEIDKAIKLKKEYYANKQQP